MNISGWICEGHRCSKGPNGTRANVSWDTDRAKSDPNYLMPDAWFRFIITQAVYEEPAKGQHPSQPFSHTFCSPGCLRDFYGQNYVEPLSPRERAAQDANNQEVEKRRQQELAAREDKEIKPASA